MFAVRPQPRILIRAPPYPPPWPIVHPRKRTKDINHKAQRSAKLLHGALVLAGRLLAGHVAQAVREAVKGPVHIAQHRVHVAENELLHAAILARPAWNEPQLGHTTASRVLVSIKYQSRARP